MCWKCARAEDNVHSYCDGGWTIAKAIARTRKQRAYYDMDHESRQDTLW